MLTDAALGGATVGGGTRIFEEGKRSSEATPLSPPHPGKCLGHQSVLPAVYFITFAAKTIQLHCLIYSFLCLVTTLKNNNNDEAGPVRPWVESSSSSVRSMAGCRHGCVQAWLQHSSGKAQGSGAELNSSFLMKQRRPPTRHVTAFFLPQLFSQQSDPKLQGCTVSGLSLNRSSQTLRGISQSLSVQPGLWHTTLVPGQKKKQTIKNSE